MKFEQWIKHLFSWLLMFPMWKEDTHTWIGVVGDGNSECLICGATKFDEEDEFDYDTSSHMLRSLCETHGKEIAAIKSERFVPYWEILIPIEDDHVAYIYMDEEAYSVLMKESEEE